MSPREIYDRYVAQHHDAELPGFRRERLPGLVRYSPLLPNLDGFVTYSRHTSAELPGVIATQIAHFAELGRAFEWKVYDFDTPSDLIPQLLAAGFKAGVREAFMVYPVEQHRPPARAVRVERVRTAAALRDVLSVQEIVWGNSLAWLESSLADQHRDAAIFCAYAGDEPVGTGWIDFTPGSDFADLHGGSVVPAWRGHGVYSALLHHRVEAARARGATFLAVDAAPMSRPILLRRGFTFVCETTPLIHA